MPHDVTMTTTSILRLTALQQKARCVCRTPSGRSCCEPVSEPVSEQSPYSIGGVHKEPHSHPRGGCLAVCSTTGLGPPVQSDYMGPVHQHHMLSWHLENPRTTGSLEGCSASPSNPRSLWLPCWRSRAFTLTVQSTSHTVSQITTSEMKPHLTSAHDNTSFPPCPFIIARYCF
jgi:hypothetical protein